MDEGPEKGDSTFIALAVVFVIVLIFFSLLTWAGSRDLPPQNPFMMTTENLSISQMTVGNESYWCFSYEVKDIIGENGAEVETINLDRANVVVKHYNGSPLAMDLPVNEHDLSDYDSGEDGSVDIQCWYDDIGIQDGRLGEGDLILITGVPFGVPGVSFEMWFNGDPCWHASVDLTDQ